MKVNFSQEQIDQLRQIFKTVSLPQQLPLPMPLHPAVEIIRYDGSGLGYILLNDGTGWEEFEGAVNLKEVNGLELDIDGLYLARGFGESDNGYPVYYTVCCGANNCDDGINQCDQCQGGDCAARVFEFDINNAEVPEFNGHYKVQWLTNCLWQGSLNGVEATLQYSTLPDIGDCWNIKLDDGSDQIYYSLDCPCVDISASSCCNKTAADTFTVNIDCPCLADQTFVMNYDHTAGDTIYWKSNVEDYCGNGTFYFYVYCLGGSNWKLLPYFSCDPTQQLPVAVSAVNCDPFELQFDNVTFPCIDCNASIVVVSPPQCPTSICLTSDIADGSCACTGVNGDFILDGSCGYYSMVTQVCDTPVNITWVLTMTWNSDYTEMTDITLTITIPSYDEDGNYAGEQSIGSWYNAGPETLPLTLTFDMCTSTICNSCDATMSIDYAANCGNSPPADCSCNPPQTLTATLIDYTTGNCSACLGSEITLVYNAGIYKWIGSGTWCGQSITIGLRCAGGQWQLQVNSPSFYNPEGNVVCSPFNGVWFVPFEPVCTAYIQVTQ